MYFTNDELIFIESAVAMITAVWLSVSSSAELKLLNAIFVPNEIVGSSEVGVNVGFGEGGVNVGFGEGVNVGFGEGGSVEDIK